MNKHKISSWIFFPYVLTFLIAINRFHILPCPALSGYKTTCVVEFVSYDFIFRNYLEHLMWGFTIPAFMVILGFGITDFLKAEKFCWRGAYLLGFMVVIVAAIWYYSNMPSIQWIDLSFEIMGLLLAYIYLNCIIK